MCCYRYVVAGDSVSHAGSPPAISQDSNDDFDITSSQQGSA